MIWPWSLLFLGVFFEHDCTTAPLINIALTTLGFIPGVIHAFYIMLKLVMKNIILTSLLVLCLSLSLVNADCVSCHECVSRNIPKAKDGNRILYTGDPVCSNPTNSGFTIRAFAGYYGCGYAKDINQVYEGCSKECKVCQKIDKPCTDITEPVSSKIKCPSMPCIQRGGSISPGRDCCDGLITLDPFNPKCVAPGQDCTRCGGKIEANKPSCDPSGIKVDGRWKCAGGGGCKENRECPSNQICSSGICKVNNEG
ncbi:uncharacterized protein BX664DRAFT_369903 [Halteromyces radiatus]|uniref:uncharacterized protein n=1 Tax=Halteromyces radiatus TaxID=101107 RepID=UPI00221ECBF0|nr:uncharacterized protein BX664DRAFT_369903 [Halteromyces radiatus]KAI8096179.1 hypothetical protein BX664DRAFT_369903 [Halteromyces radiatus]